MLMTHSVHHTAIGRAEIIGALPFDWRKTNNIAIGRGAMMRLTTGMRNYALCAGALENLTTGSGNIGIGRNAGAHLTTESNQCCIGSVRVPYLFAPALRWCVIAVARWLRENGVV